MPGLLLLAAAIGLDSTFRRGGVAFVGREPVTVDIRDVTGLQLRQLLDEPLISIEISDEDGNFAPLPEIDPAATAEELDMMLDALVSQLPPRDRASSASPAFLVDPASGGVTALNAISEADLSARGVESVEQLLAQFDELGRDLAAVRSANQLNADELAAARQLIADQKTLIADQAKQLEAANAKLQATPGDAGGHQPKPAKAGKGKPPSQGSGAS